MKRTLSLKRESLSALTNDEMGAVGTAGSLPTSIEPHSLDPVTRCVGTVWDSALVCSGSGCNTWNSDCSCRI